MAATARLRHGADLIYFEDGTSYQLGDDFTPPGSSLAASFSDGTSANVYGGGVKTAEKAYNREITITVLCVATTANNAAPQSLASRLVTMLGKAGDETNPVWFEWTLTPGLPEPVWGQFGAWRRAEVRHAGWVYSDDIGQYSRNEVVEIQVSLTVAPYALGTRQVLAASTNAFVDYFATDGYKPTGLKAPYGGAVVNYMTNPIWGNRSGYFTNWTATVASTIVENKTPAYIYPGLERSVEILSSTADNPIYQAITVSSTADHYFTAWVKRKDGGAVTSADCDLYYGSALSTAFTLLGNAVYRLSATAAGIVAATNTGLQVKAGKSVFFLASQCTNAPAYDLICGDIPGNTWAGTAHASASSRVVGAGAGATVYQDKNLQDVSFAIVYTPDYASSSIYGGVVGLLNLSDFADAGLYNTLDVWHLVDGTYDAASSTADGAFTAGETIRLIATMGAGGMFLYKNGTQIATSNGNFQRPSQAYPGIGHFTGTGLGVVAQAQGTIKAFEMYNEQLTQAQVTALDAAMAACGDYIDCPAIMQNPSILQAASSASPWASYGWTDAIPGNAPPIFDMESIASAIAADSEAKFTTLQNLPISFAPTGFTYDSSTAAVAISSTAEDTIATWTAYRLNEIMGKTVYIAFRMTDAGANLQANFKLDLGYVPVQTGLTSITADATMRMFFLGPLYVPSRAAFPERSIQNTNVQATATLTAKRTTGGASNVELDYVSIMLPNLTRISRYSAISSTADYLSYFDGTAVLYAGIVPSEILRVFGDRMTLSPMGKSLIHFQPGISGTANALTETITLLGISGVCYITPRWAL